MASSSFSCCVLVLIVFVIGVQCQQSPQYPEKRLIKKLLGNYRRVGIQGRPVTNHLDTLPVDFGLGLIRIPKVDEDNEIVNIQAYARHQWVDPLLKWDPADYGGVDKIRVSIDDIWTPDITLYNGLETRFLKNTERLAVVFPRGRVLWMPYVIYTVRCTMRKGYDQHDCWLRFGSWTYDGTELDINFYDGLERMDLYDYVDRHWKIVENQADKNERYRQCYSEPFLDLAFNLTLKIA